MSFSSKNNDSEKNERRAGHPAFFLTGIIVRGEEKT